MGKLPLKYDRLTAVLDAVISHRGFHDATLVPAAIPSRLRFRHSSPVQCRWVLDSGATPCLEPRPDCMMLEALLLYEDVEMGLRGKEIFDFIAKEVEVGDAATLKVWRFDCFHSAELASEVSRSAQSADVIIFASRCSKGLPAFVQSWLECWPLQRERAGLIIACFPPTASDARRMPDAALLLWRAATRARMDFICRVHKPVPAGLLGAPLGAPQVEPALCGSP